MMLDMNEKNQEMIEKGIRRSNRLYDKDEINKLNFHTSRIVNAAKLKMEKQ